MFVFTVWVVGAQDFEADPDLEGDSIGALLFGNHEFNTPLSGLL